MPKFLLQTGTETALISSKCAARLPRKKQAPKEREGTAMTTQAVAVITGGSNGIGAATARLFASREYAIAILDVNQERGEKLAAALSANGGAARFYACDVSDAKAVAAIAARVEKDLGLAEVLV